VHFLQGDPFCAQLWCRKHLNAPVFAEHSSRERVTEETCRVRRSPDVSWPALGREWMFRAPEAAGVFGDVALLWYVGQDDRPLVSTRGHLYDHIAPSVVASTPESPSSGAKVSGSSRRPTGSATRGR